MTQNFVVRILTLGFQDVGKTSLLLRYFKDEFHEQYVSTIGIDFKSKPVKINKNTTVKIMVWDTAGQEKYRGIVKSFYNKANGILLTFDLSNRTSFDKIDYWVNELKEYTDVENLYIVLVGNKCDKTEREVTYEEAQKYSEDNNFGGYFEVSAKSNEGIDKLFLNVARGSLEKIMKNNEDDFTEQTLRLSVFEDKKAGNKKKGCCYSSGEKEKKTQL